MSLRCVGVLGFHIRISLGHHPGACHKDCVTFPVSPVESLGIPSAAIDTIEVGLEAAFIPPCSCELLSTMIWPYIIVKILSREVGLVMDRK